MKKRSTISRMLGAVDVASAPLTYISGRWLKFIRRADIARMPHSRNILGRIGVFPIRDHYYEPLITQKSLRRPLQEDRRLPGIDLNAGAQLELLRLFTYQQELVRLPLDPTSNNGEKHFYFHNPAYGPGDAECLYSMIRHFKPARIVEVGSGFSTLVTREAILANQADDPAYRCQLTCIEPYEQPWLERLNVRVLREPVERLGPECFSELEANDILIIDSSHMIRAQGDVLYLYQEVLPNLAAGVLAHVHDIFTPKDYPSDWILKDVRFWNEQYLLEAFLTFNREFRVIAALNYLAHHYREEMARAFPIFAGESSTCEPGAFWMQRV